MASYPRGLVIFTFTVMGTQIPHILPAFPFKTKIV
jgi:hypothetical protein